MDDDKLSALRLCASETHSGAIDIVLLTNDGKYVCFVGAIPSWSPYAATVLQYVDWLNRQLDEYEKMQREVAAIKAELEEWLGEMVEELS